MSLDITILRVLKTREKYQRLARGVPMNAIDERTKILLADFGAYFAEFPDVKKLDKESFMLWFTGFRHPGLKPEAAAVFTQVIANVADIDVDPGVESGLSEKLLAADTAQRLTELLGKWNTGDEVDLYRTARKVLEDYELQTVRKVHDAQVRDPIEKLLADEENEFGFKFRQPELNASIKPLGSGDFMVFAGRVDTGKTTFCADFATFAASQVDKLYPGEDRSVLWFNNEGPGRKIVTRTFQAAGGWTIEEMTALSKQPAQDPSKYRHRLHELYTEHIGGRGGALRIMDIHDRWSHDVEELMKRYRPAGVIFDMVDNIRFGGDVNNNGQRTDQILEAMYQWARLMAVKHDTWAIATSQTSADAEGLAYPTLPMLKDSKTGKAGAADVILTMGTVNEAGMEKSRFFGCTKNKKVPTAAPKSPKVEMYFDGDRSRIYVPKNQ